MFIHILGGHSTGKSSLAGKLLEMYNHKGLVTVGKYKKSEINNEYYIGGMDSFHMTNPERFEEIKKAWFSDSPVIVAEGMMAIYFSSFLSRYPELQKQKYRKIVIVHLYVSEKTMLERMFVRSKGKPLNEKRMGNIRGKAQVSKNNFRKAGYCYSSWEMMDIDTENFDINNNIVTERVGEYIKWLEEQNDTKQ